MNTTLKLKLGLLIFFIIGSITTIVPSFYKDSPDWWKKYLAPEGLRLGLDLQGGMHVVMKVNLEKAAVNTLELAADNLKDSLSEDSITAVRTKSNTPGTIIFTLPNASSIEKVEGIINDDDDIKAEIEAEAGSFPRILISLTQAKLDYIQDNAVNQSLEIIRNRIDEFGVAEPVIIRQGEDEIVIQLPGVKDPERAMDLIGKTAQLEFKVVAEPAGLDLNELIAKAVSSGQWQEDEPTRKLNRALESLLPADTSIYFEKEIDKQTQLEISRPLLL
jgi:SecD/SecF fusion protein